MDKKGISNKIENKENMKDNNEYLDIYPNGKAYKHLANDDNEEEKKEPIKIEEKNEVVDTAIIDDIKKKDENDIVNIINKGLEENKLVEKQPVADSANDFLFGGNLD